MSDTTLNQFISRGTNAQRVAFTPSPATPASGNNPSYIFFETDTANTYMWDGSAWQKINTGSGTSGPIPVGLQWDNTEHEEVIVPVPGNFSSALPGLVPPSGGGTANFLRADGTFAAPSGSSAARPVVVQTNGSIGNNFNVTMGSTPTAGNFMIAFCSHFNASPTAGTGWTLVENINGGANDGVACSVKVASSTDTTAQTPFIGGVGGGSVVIYEVSGALAILPLNKIGVHEDSTTPFDVAITASRANSVLIGAVFRGGSNTAFTISTYTTDLDITGTAAGNSPKRTQGIHLNTNAGTSGTISLTFTGGDFGAYILELLGG